MQFIYNEVSIAQYFIIFWSMNYKSGKILIIQAIQHHCTGILNSSDKDTWPNLYESSISKTAH